MLCSGRRILKVTDLQVWPKEYSVPYIVNVGGIKLPICAYCEATGATTYCRNDDTKLCLTCDLKVHCNKISAQHKREPTKDIEVCSLSSFLKYFSGMLKVPVCFLILSGKIWKAHRLAMAEKGT